MEKDIYDQLKFEIGYHQSQDNSIKGVDWTADYTEGYTDGLKRAIEIIEDLEYMNGRAVSVLPCEYTLDGVDTDGTDWYHCETHNELAPSGSAPCAGWLAEDK